MTPLSVLILAAAAFAAGSGTTEIAGTATDPNATPSVPATQVRTGTKYTSEKDRQHFLELQKALLESNGISTKAATDPTAAKIVAPPKPPAVKALSVSPETGNANTGTVGAPGATTPGGVKPPQPTPEEQRRAAFDDTFGPQTYENILKFYGSGCSSHDGCNKLDSWEIIDGGSKYAALEKKVADHTLDRNDPDYQRQDTAIKNDLRDPLIAVRPADRKPTPSEAELASLSQPVVEKVFPDGLVQSAPEPPPSQPQPIGHDPHQDPGDQNPGSSLPRQSQQAYNNAVTGSHSLAPGSAAGSGAGPAGSSSVADWLINSSLSAPSVSVDAGGGGMLAATSAGAGASLSSLPAETPAAGAQTAPEQALSAAAPNAVRREADLTNAARRSLSMGDAAAAASTLKVVVAANPRDGKALALLSMAESRLKDFPAALAAAQQGLKLAPNNPAFLDAAAYAYNGLHDFTHAQAAAEAALKVNPRDALAHFNRAIAFAGQGKRAEMLDSLRQAAAISPKFAPYLATAEQLPTEGDMNFLAPQAASARAAAPTSSQPGTGSAWELAAGVAGAAALIVVLAGLARRRAAAPAPAPPARRANGLLAGKYQLGRQLGAGGMGIVFEGRDVTLDRRVAVKRMREEIRWDERERERFVTEARVVARMSHPNIVGILEIAEENGEVYLVFEHVAGRTLKEIMESEGRLTIQRAAEIFGGAAAALDYAQTKGVIHRDFKPANVMLEEGGRARVMDFGIARAATEAVSRHVATRATVAVGTPAYMAPEQEQGVATPQSDVFSLAVCLYEALTGQRPHPGMGGGLLMNKIKKVFTPPSQLAAGLPQSVDALFDRALDPDPLKRPATAGALMRELEKLAT